MNLNLQKNVSCKICQKNSIEFLGKKPSRYFKDYVFEFYQCGSCNFRFIANPITDYKNLYDEKYYSGQGCDPKVSYLHEISNPQKSVRKYEWQGVYDVVSNLTNTTNRWLDFGCGNGGLVKYIGEKYKHIDIIGYEEGWIKEKFAEQKINYINEDALDKYQHSFDVITSIEVLEHVENPLETLKVINKLLKPGGLFFYTTGNAKPHANNFLNWSYVVPEVHISYYEPLTMKYALEASGFTTESKGRIKGFENIIRFKVLKNLGIKNQYFFEKTLPWTLISSVVDKKFKVTDFPIAWAK